jgi:SAM-dependent methyltransferase
VRRQVRAPARTAFELAWRVRAIASRGRWRQAAATGAPPRTVFGSVGDRHWLWLNTKGYRAEAALRSLLPALPDEALQERFTGARQDQTLRQGWQVYRLFRSLYDAHSGRLGPATSVLDFGCGWGRIIRFFLKDVDSANLLGIDSNRRAIEACEATNRWCSFRLVDVLPPTALPDGGFDLVYAYSVFSHLSEEAHDRWLHEFARVLKPGGLLIATTRPRSFISFCDRLRSNEATATRFSARCFPNARATLARYDAGEYCFSHPGVGGAPHFGEACIPREYVLRHWIKRFAFVDYIDDRRRCEQDVIVVRKP